MNLLPVSRPLVYSLMALLVFFLFMYVMAPIRLWQIGKKLDKMIAILKEIRDKK